MVPNFTVEKPPVAKRILDFDRVLLREEGSGILNWALAGFAKLQEEFAAIGDFSLTEAQRAEMAEAALSVLETWLTRGVDGFRVDVAHGLHAQVILGDALSVAETGGAVVAGAGADLCESVSHGAAS